MSGAGDHGVRGVQIIRMVDALAVRIAGSAECRKMDLRLEEIGKQVAVVEAQLAPNKVQGLKYQVDTVLAAVDTMVRSRRLRTPCSLPAHGALRSSHVPARTRR